MEELIYRLSWCEELLCKIITLKIIYTIVIALETYNYNNSTIYKDFTRKVKFYVFIYFIPIIEIALLNEHYNISKNGMYIFLFNFYPYFIFKKGGDKSCITLLYL